MTSRHAAVAVLILLATAVAVVVGVFAVEASTVVLPLTLEVLVLAAVTWMFVLRYDPDDPGHVWLGRLLLAALVVRLGLAVVVNVVFSGELFAPDVLGYEYFGRRLSEYWQGQARTPGSVFDSWQAGYHYLNGAFFYLFGGVSPLGPVVLNIFVSLWTVVLGFRLGRIFGSDRMAKTAALLVAFFPSLVLWSVVNIRDAISTFLVTLAAYLIVRAVRRIRMQELFLLAVALLALSLVRQYMVMLVGFGAVLGVVASVRTGRIAETLVVGVAVSFVAVLGLENLGLLEQVPAETPFEAVASIREQMMTGASSSFGEQLDPSTPTGALLALPVGLVYLLFAPFPWAVSSLLQLLTLPEVLLWYALVPFTLVGLRRAWSDAPREILIPIGILAVVLSTYALVEGNIGTAYRHRAQIMPLLFLFTAGGISRILARRRSRRERKLRRRREARARIQGRSR